MRKKVIHGLGCFLIEVFLRGQIILENRSSPVLCGWLRGHYGKAIGIMGSGEMLEVAA
jgi:hypothetical protein